MLKKYAGCKVVSMWNKIASFKNGWGTTEEMTEQILFRTFCLLTCLPASWDWIEKDSFPTLAFPQRETYQGLKQGKPVLCRIAVAKGEDGRGRLGLWTVSPQELAWRAKANKWRVSWEETASYQVLLKSHCGTNKLLRTSLAFSVFLRQGLSTLP